jgi:hypothetical protein
LNIYFNPWFVFILCLNLPLKVTSPSSPNNKATCNFSARNIFHNPNYFIFLLWSSGYDTVYLFHCRILSWRWRQHILPKHPFSRNRLCRHKATTKIFMAVKITILWNYILFYFLFGFWEVIRFDSFWCHFCSSSSDRNHLYLKQLNLPRKSLYYVCFQTKRECWRWFVIIEEDDDIIHAYTHSYVYTYTRACITRTCTHTHTYTYIHTLMLEGRQAHKEGYDLYFVDVRLPLSWQRLFRALLWPSENARIVPCTSSRPPYYKALLTIHCFS